jgi:hypothetical protein
MVGEVDCAQSVPENTMLAKHLSVAFGSKLLDRDARAR